ncbi:MAG: DUF5694 domain-containing protein [Pseudomonadota bacterium]
MFRPLSTAAIAVLCFLLPGTVQAEDQGEQPVEVMVLGTFHFANPGADLINLEFDNMLSDKRQAELDELAKALAAFEPTVVVTERTTSPPDYRDPYYEHYDEEMLATVANERVQIAYRLADMANVHRVYGIDESANEGEPNYFPFAAVMEHAERNGTADGIRAMQAETKALLTAEQDRVIGMHIIDALREVNSGYMSSPEFYYRLLRFDSGEDQPGAELNAYWFMRNAKTFSKLEDVTRPGDRVVMVYGFGHKFWLDHLVEQTPGFELIPPEKYLRLSE